MNDQFAEIPKAEFMQGNNEIFYNINFEKEDTVYNVRVQRKTQGMLSAEEMAALKSNLNHSLERRLVISYYPGLDACNKSSDNNPYVISDLKSYPKKFKQAGVDFLLLYINSEGLKNRMKKFDWKEDKDQFVHNMFLKIHYPCDSSIVLFPDGRFVTFKGEHSWGDVFDTAVSKNK
ncbi:MAG: hypothetical protein K0M56_11510 [Kaistella sp.]|nr:hypothetical protein [Kaistella sp.]